MILAELHLQNYKQYAGEHRIEFPAQGIIAVIGANGVGKTTLFEAIEWCLYNPREIANKEVPPRGGVGHTCVRVVLEDPRDGVRYVVERTLRREVTGGEVYREDQPEAPLAQGTRPVTDYVARRLIGLSHRAFVSTFFTRQKELTFFGNLKETERRVEVARLLGFDTIRDAQRLLGDERTLAKNEASLLAAQHAAESAGRDFPAEIAAAEAAIGRAETEHATATAHHAAAVERHAGARAELDRWLALGQRDAAFGQELERIGGDERAATVRRQSAEANLHRLDAAAAQRATLLPLSAAEPERRAAVAGFVAERERFERRRQLEADRRRAEASGGDAAREMERTVGRIRPDGIVPDWAWTAPDAADPIAGAERLLAVAARLDVVAAAARADALLECRRRIEAREQAEEIFGRYRGHLSELEQERTTILAGGDPHAAAAQAQRERESAVADAESARARAEAARANRRKLEPIVASLRTAAQAQACPTCGRPFRPEEIAVSLAALEDRIADEARQEAAMAHRGQDAQAAADAAEAVRLRAQALVQDLVKLDGRIAQGRPMVDEASAAFKQRAAECVASLAGLGLTAEPTTEQVETARAQAQLLEAIDRTQTLLRRLAGDAQRAATDAAAAAAALVDLGPVDYDAIAHTAAEAALAEARDAISRIARIDEELAQRGDYEAERTTAAADLDHLAGERTRLEAERLALGFDRAELDRADAAEKSALRDARGAAQELSDAQASLRAVVADRDDLRKQQARVADLALRAEARGRDADELDRMYREFTRFDQYVAAQITPQLADHTGEILGAVTDHKYDRVIFDDNYGLRIFDEDESFAIEEFSGGERDVAALCARLALSRLVGGQAAHPPRFLVLDEVFGSLDQDRRSQVLETLGQLAAGSEAFRQLFIISHVDDVRLSAIVDEVWRISEVDGVSRFENLTRAGTLAEF